MKNEIKKYEVNVKFYIDDVRIVDAENEDDAEQIALQDAIDWYIDDAECEAKEISTLIEKEIKKLKCPVCRERRLRFIEEPKDQPDSSWRIYSHYVCDNCQRIFDEEMNQLQFKLEVIR